MRVGTLVLAVIVSGFSLQSQQACAQPTSQSSQSGDAVPPGVAIPSIHRLILKDGSYQVVSKWQIVHPSRGEDRVRYISAERGGDPEELPVSLIDWQATRAFAKQHVGDPASPASENAGQDQAAAIDAEEKADRNRNLEVAPHLLLPDATGIWALDTFHDQPELVDLEQNTVNPRTGHNVVRSTLNASGATHQNIELNERHAKPALHGSQPVFYVSLDPPDQEPGSGALTVDTHGAGSQKGPETISSPNSRFVIIHADVRKDFRFVGSVRINAFGPEGQLPAKSADSNVLLTKTEILPGSHWMKVTSLEPVSAGDYVLMEVLSAKEVNLAVWDFRIDPGAGDNENAILPLHR